ncbi:MAG: Ig-like domain-containing protein [Planctomycetota bacterium]
MLTVLYMDENGRAVCACGVCAGTFCGKADAMETRLSATIEQLPSAVELAREFGANPTIHDPANIVIQDTSSEVGRDGRSLAALDPEFPGSEFEIDLNFNTSLTTSQRQAFEDAAEVWESIILGDTRNVFFSDGSMIDDLVIDVFISNIDGQGGVLGQAGPSGFRPGSFGDDAFVSFAGFMQFDSADVAGLEAIGEFDEVVIHEMGHVLGVGTSPFWDSLTVGEGGSNPRFTGENAVAEFNKLTRDNRTSVPVENTGGGGSRDSHWRDSFFGAELMSSFFSGSAGPLSRFTAGLMIDLGYNDVNLDAAEIYQIPGASTNTSATFNRVPNISSLTATGSESGVTLTANNVSDSDGVARVEFFRESNGIPGLQSETSNPDTAVGIDTNASGGYSVTLAANTVPDGTSTYYGRSIDSFGASSRIRTTTNDFVADSVAPAPVNSVFEIDAPQEQAAILFDEAILPGAGDASLLNLDTNTTTTPTVLSIAGQTVRLDLSTDLLDNGNYVLTLPEGFTTDAAGNDSEAASLSFYVLRGDIDRDRDVDLFDAIDLQRNFGMSSGAVYTDGDLDYDGDVDLFDALILQRAFGDSLPAGSLSTGALFADNSTANPGLSSGGSRSLFSGSPISNADDMFGDGDGEILRERTTRPLAAR